MGAADRSGAAAALSVRPERTDVPPPFTAGDRTAHGEESATSDRDIEHDTLFNLPLSPEERHRAAGKDMIPLLFDDEPHFAARHIETLSQVKALSQELKSRGYKISLTNGSFDLLHIGHSMYLERARSFGDFLFVGVDSDAKIRERKGPGRPLVPEDERLRMLTYQRAVGAVFLKSPEHKQWTLIKHVRPDVLVVTADAYSPRSIQELKSKFNCEIRVLERMATVSTTGRLRTAQMGGTAIPEDDPLPLFVEAGPETD